MRRHRSSRTQAPSRLLRIITISKLQQMHSVPPVMEIRCAVDHSPVWKCAYPCDSDRTLNAVQLDLSTYLPAYLPAGPQPTMLEVPLNHRICLLITKSRPGGYNPLAS